MLSRASLGDVLRVARKASRSVRLSCALDRQRDALYLSPGALLVTFDKRGVLTAASQGIRRELGAHERSCPDWKHRPMVGASGPDLNEVRVQHCRSSWVLTASPTEVRAQIVPGLEAFNHVRDVKPGPERSEGAPSQKVGR